MSDHDPFPNVKEKLTAPTKKSAFEKSRLEAEAKRLREEAETAAVYKDFVASFDEEPPHPAQGSGFNNGPRGGSFRGGLRGGPPSGPGRRHFTGPPPSARGGANGPPGRKRNLDAAFERDHDEAGVFSAVGAGLSDREKRRLRESNTGLLAFENSVPLGGKSKDQYSDDDSDSETSKPHPKPTLSLSSLPPSTTKPILTSLFMSTSLRIDSIRIIPAPPPPGPSQPSPSIRKAASALITLSPETPSSDIDSAVTALNGRYLGSGFWLNISRHLPSTAIGTATALPTLTTPISHPFGAKAPPQAHPTRGGLSRAPPPHRGGFAPPSSFAQNTRTTGLQVHVHPPTDLRALRLIHKTLEQLLTHGPGFEALLMSSESVRADVKFSWLWDARSPEGVYYRWKLWEIVTGQARQAAVEVFEPSAQISAIWIPPRKALKYEWAGSLKDIVEDEGFSSDELEDDGDSGDEEVPAGEGKRGRGYLGVLERAKLVHLIARIPTQTSRVRRGDIGRVMAFAMEHAEGGMGEEVVTVLVGNVLKPLAFTRVAKVDDSDEEDDTPPKQTDESESYAAKIIGLWLISDVLSNSSLGIRNAWRYRQLFDTALRERKVFAHLGDVYRTPGWGRMKAEKFRRGVVEGVLEWWEKWCIFPQTTQDTFLSSFLHPTSNSPSTTPSSATATATATVTKPTRATTPAAPAAKSKWKTVESKPEAFNPETAIQPTADDDEDVDGEPMVDEDVDGEPMVEDEDVDGEPMKDSDVDGEPMKEDGDVDGEEMKDEDEGDRELKEMFDAGGDGAGDSVEMEEKAGLGLGMTGFKMGGATRGGKAPSGGPRKRMRAEDMFADDED